MVDPRTKREGVVGHHEETVTVDVTGGRRGLNSRSNNPADESAALLFGPSRSSHPKQGRRSEFQGPPAQKPVADFSADKEGQQHSVSSSIASQTHQVPRDDDEVAKMRDTLSQAGHEELADLLRGLSTKENRPAWNQGGTGGAGAPRPIRVGVGPAGASFGSCPSREDLENMQQGLKDSGHAELADLLRGLSTNGPGSGRQQQHPAQQQTAQQQRPFWMQGGSSNGKSGANGRPEAPPGTSAPDFMARMEGLSLGTESGTSAASSRASTANANAAPQQQQQQRPGAAAPSRSSNRRRPGSSSAAATQAGKPGEQGLPDGLFAQVDKGMKNLDVDVSSGPSSGAHVPPAPPAAATASSSASISPRRRATQQQQPPAAAQAGAHQAPDDLFAKLYKGIKNLDVGDSGPSAASPAAAPAAAPAFSASNVSPRRRAAQQQQPQAAAAQEDQAAPAARASAFFDAAADLDARIKKLSMENDSGPADPDHPAPPVPQQPDARGASAEAAAAAAPHPQASSAAPGGPSVAAEPAPRFWIPPGKQEPSEAEVPGGAGDRPSGFRFSGATAAAAGAAEKVEKVLPRRAARSGRRKQTPAAAKAPPQPPLPPVQVQQAQQQQQQESSLPRRNLGGAFDAALSPPPPQTGQGVGQRGSGDEGAAGGRSAAPLFSAPAATYTGPFPRPVPLAAEGSSRAPPSFVFGAGSSRGPAPGPPSAAAPASASAAFTFGAGSSSSSLPKAAPAPAPAQPSFVFGAPAGGAAAPPPKAQPSFLFGAGGDAPAGRGGPGGASGSSAAAAATSTKAPFAFGIEGRSSGSGRSVPHREGEAAAPPSKAPFAHEAPAQKASDSGAPAGQGGFVFGGAAVAASGVGAAAAAEGGGSGGGNKGKGVTPRRFVRRMGRPGAGSARTAKAPESTASSAAQAEAAGGWERAFVAAFGAPAAEEPAPSQAPPRRPKPSPAADMDWSPAAADANASFRKATAAPQRPSQDQPRAEEAPSGRRGGSPDKAAASRASRKAYVARRGRERPATAPPAAAEAAAAPSGAPGAEGGGKGKGSEAEAEKHRRAGNTAFKEKRYDSAERHYTQSIRHLRALPGTCHKAALALALSNRAASRLMARQPLSAEADCKEAVAAEPGFSRARLRLATCNLRMGRFQAARDALKGMVAQAAEGGGNAAKEGADAKAKLKDVEAAASAALEAAATLGEGRREGLRAALLEGALSKIDAAARYAEFSPALQAWRSEVLLLLGRHEEALRHAAAPGCAEMESAEAGGGSWRWWARAQVAWLRGDLDAASKTLKEGMLALEEESRSSRKQPEVPLCSIPSPEELRESCQQMKHLLALKEQGNAAIKAGDPARARELYASALSAPGCPAGFASLLLSNTAATLQKEGDVLQAIATCTRACALNPAFRKPYSRLASLLLDLGMSDHAAKVLEKMQETCTLTAAEKKEATDKIQWARGPVVSAKPANHYKLLGLEQGCASDEVRKAYKKLALKYHPDKAMNHVGKPAAAMVAGWGDEGSGGEGDWCARLREEAALLFKCIGEAHEVLTDDTKRAALDRKLNPPRAPSASSRRHTSAYDQYQRYRNQSASSSRNSGRRGSNTANGSDRRYTGQGPSYYNANRYGYGYDDFSDDDDSFNPYGRW